MGGRGCEWKGRGHVSWRGGDISGRRHKWEEGQVGEEGICEWGLGERHEWKGKGHVSWGGTQVGREET